MDDVSRLGGGIHQDSGRHPDQNGGLDSGGWNNGMMSQFQTQPNLGWTFGCQRYLGTVAAGLLAIMAVCTPIAMVVLPRLQIVPLRSEQLRFARQVGSMRQGMVKNNDSSEQ